MAGERVSLIGSNGAGKTTFVNLITGYIKPDTGRILLDGHDIAALHPRAISRWVSRARSRFRSFAPTSRRWTTCWWPTPATTST